MVTNERRNIETPHVLRHLCYLYVDYATSKTAVLAERPNSPGSERTSATNQDAERERRKHLELLFYQEVKVLPVQPDVPAHVLYQRYLERSPLITDPELREELTRLIALGAHPEAASYNPADFRWLQLGRQWFIELLKTDEQPGLPHVTRGSVFLLLEPARLRTTALFVPQTIIDLLQPEFARVYRLHLTRPKYNFTRTSHGCIWRIGNSASRHIEARTYHPSTPNTATSSPESIGSKDLALSRPAGPPKITVSPSATRMQEMSEEEGEINTTAQPSSQLPTPPQDPRDPPRRPSRPIPVYPTVRHPNSALRPSPRDRSPPRAVVDDDRPAKLGIGIAGAAARYRAGIVTPSPSSPTRTNLSRKRTASPARRAPSPKRTSTSLDRHAVGAAIRRSKPPAPSGGQPQKNLALGGNSQPSPSPPSSPRPPNPTVKLEPPIADRSDPFSGQPVVSQSATATGDVVPSLHPPPSPTVSPPLQSPAIDIRESINLSAMTQDKLRTRRNSSTDRTDGTTMELSQTLAASRPSPGLTVTASTAPASPTNLSSPLAGNDGEVVLTGSVPWAGRRFHRPAPVIAASAHDNTPHVTASDRFETQASPMVSTTPTLPQPDNDYTRTQSCTALVTTRPPAAFSIVIPPKSAAPLVLPSRAETPIGVTKEVGTPGCGINPTGASNVEVKRVNPFTTQPAQAQEIIPVRKESLPPLPLPSQQPSSAAAVVTALPHTPLSVSISKQANATPFTTTDGASDKDKQAVANPHPAFTARRFIAVSTPTAPAKGGSSPHTGMETGPNLHPVISSSSAAPPGLALPAKSVLPPATAHITLGYPAVFSSPPVPRTLASPSAQTRQQLPATLPLSPLIPFCSSETLLTTSCTPELSTASPNVTVPSDRAIPTPSVESGSPAATTSTRPYSAPLTVPPSLVHALPTDQVALFDPQPVHQVPTMGKPPIFDKPAAVSASHSSLSAQVSDLFKDALAAAAAESHAAVWPNVSRQPGTSSDPSTATTISTGTPTSAATLTANLPPGPVPETTMRAYLRAAMQQKLAQHRQPKDHTALRSQANLPSNPTLATIQQGPFTVTVMPPQGHGGGGNLPTSSASYPAQVAASARSPVPVLPYQAAPQSTASPHGHLPAVSTPVSHSPGQPSLATGPVPFVGQPMIATSTSTASSPLSSYPLGHQIYQAFIHQHQQKQRQHQQQQQQQQRFMQSQLSPLHGSQNPAALASPGANTATSPGLPSQHWEQMQQQITLLQMAHQNAMDKVGRLINSHELQHQVQLRQVEEVCRQLQAKVDHQDRQISELIRTQHQLMTRLFLPGRPQ